MKKSINKKAEYIGEIESSFIVSFQIHVLITLRLRGLISEKQCDKGIALLKEQSR